MDSSKAVWPYLVNVTRTLEARANALTPAEAMYTKTRRTDLFPLSLSLSLSLSFAMNYYRFCIAIIIIINSKFYFQQTLAADFQIISLLLNF